MIIIAKTDSEFDLTRKFKITNVREVEEFLLSIYRFNWPIVESAAFAGCEMLFVTVGYTSYWGLGRYHEQVLAIDSAKDFYYVAMILKNGKFKLKKIELS